jgi:hypothetical protein
MIDDARREIAVYKSVKCKRVFQVYKKRHVALPRSPRTVKSSSVDPRKSLIYIAFQV